jgi:membrane fusion protein (multidrug efflux system)
MKRILILICLVGLLGNTACQHKEHAEHFESTYLVTSPLKMDTVVFQEYVSQVHSIQHIELRALEKGYLQKIFVDEGQFIKKGQLMFQIMPLIYEAEKQKAQAEAEFAKIEFQNTQSLADSNIVSSNELAMSRAKLAKATAELNLAEAHLGFTQIRAPFDGIMGRFQVRLGSLLDEGELLSTLSDNSKMWIYFNVPESEYLDYVSSTGLDNMPEVKFKMANNRNFKNPGKIETIEADFNNETGNIAFRATFLNEKGILRHGETGNILMPVSFQDALIIPQKATFEILDKKYVYVVDETNTLNSREITIAHEIPHLYVISGGLDEKDKILIEGLRKVKNNQEITYDFLEQGEILSDLNLLHAE